MADTDQAQTAALILTKLAQKPMGARAAEKHHGERGQVVLHELERQGLVERRPHGPGFVWCLAATDETQAQAKQVVKVLHTELKRSGWAPEWALARLVDDETGYRAASRALIEQGHARRTTRQTATGRLPCLTLAART